MEWLELLISILSGLVVCIPVVIKLAQTFDKYAKEKNWSKIVALVISLCQEAEKLLESGEHKKQWVLNSLRVSAVETGYELTEESIAEVSLMIDQIIAATRTINAPKV